MTIGSKLAYLLHTAQQTADPEMRIGIPGLHDKFPLFWKRFWGIWGDGARRTGFGNVFRVPEYFFKIQNIAAAFNIAKNCRVVDYLL